MSVDLNEISELGLSGDGLGSALQNLDGYNVEVTLDTGETFDANVRGVSNFDIDLHQINDDGELIGDEPRTYGLGAYAMTFPERVIAINVY